MSSAGTRSVPQTRRRRRIPWPFRHGLRLLVLALVVEYLVLPQLAGARKSLHLLLDLDSWWLVCGLFFELASLTAFAVATRSILPAMHRPSLWRVLRIDLSTVAVSHCVPAGSAAGAALGLRLLSNEGVPVSEAAFAKVTQGIGAALVLQALLWTGLAIAIPLHGSSPLYVVGLAAGAALVALVAAVLLLLRRARHTSRRAAAAITRRLPRVPDLAGERVVDRVGELLDAALADKRRLAVAAAWSAANWLFDAAALWACLRAYGHTFGYDGLIVPFAVANTLAWIPVSPAGLGLIEASLIPMLVGFGSPRGTAILGVITWRLLSFWLPIPLGGVAFASLNRMRIMRGIRSVLGWNTRAQEGDPSG